MQSVLTAVIKAGFHFPFIHTFLTEATVINSFPQSIIYMETSSEPVNGSHARNRLYSLNKANGPRIDPWGTPRSLPNQNAFSRLRSIFDRTQLGLDVVAERRRRIARFFGLAPPRDRSTRTTTQPYTARCTSRRAVGFQKRGNSFYAKKRTRDKRVAFLCVCRLLNFIHMYDCHTKIEYIEGGERIDCRDGFCRAAICLKIT